MKCAKKTAPDFAKLSLKMNEDKKRYLSDEEVDGDVYQYMGECFLIRDEIELLRLYIGCNMTYEHQINNLSRFLYLQLRKLYSVGSFYRHQKPEKLLLLSQLYQNWMMPTFINV